MNSPDEAERLTSAAVVAFFDRLLIEGAGVERLIAQAASYAGGGVGLRRADGSGIARDDRGGSLDPATPATAVVGSTETGATVWVDGFAGETATVFLERLAVAAAVVELWNAADIETAPEPIEVLLDDSAGDAARAAALERLHIAPDTSVRAVICSGPDEGVEELIDEVGTIETVIARTRRDDKTVILLAAGRTDGLAIHGVRTAVRAAYGRVVDAEHAHLTYRNARDAYRFTLPSSSHTGPYQTIMATWVDGARLSGLAALCRLSREEIDLVPEVGVLEGLADKHGEYVLRVLEAYAATESLRRGAAQVHMHHNSIRYWVDKAEEEFGYSLQEPYRRALLFISLCLLRLRRGQEFD